MMHPLVKNGKIKKCPIKNSEIGQNIINSELKNRPFLAVRTQWKSEEPGPRTRTRCVARVCCVFFRCRAAPCGHGLRGHTGANTQDWALFWPKVDRKLGIVGCSLFGAWDGQDGGSHRTKGLHCTALHLQDCSLFFPFFFVFALKLQFAGAHWRACYCINLWLNFGVHSLLGLLIPTGLVCLG